MSQHEMCMADSSLETHNDLIQLSSIFENIMDLIYL